jgi:hypothetical protein
MPFGKAGEVLCAVCQERLKTTDKTIRMESSNALAHAKCAGLAIATVSREHVRLLLFRATRCLSCLMKSTDLREHQLHAILEELRPEIATVSAPCEDCHALGVGYRIG